MVRFPHTYKMTGSYLNNGGAFFFTKLANFGLLFVPKNMIQSSIYHLFWYAINFTCSFLWYKWREWLHVYNCTGGSRVIAIFFLCWNVCATLSIKNKISPFENFTTLFILIVHNSDVISVLAERGANCLLVVLSNVIPRVSRWAHPLDTFAVSLDFVRDLRGCFCSCG